MEVLPLSHVTLFRSISDIFLIVLSLYASLIELLFTCSPDEGAVLRKLYYISFRFLHRILVTGETLRGWNMRVDWSCKFCGHRVETFYHLFNDCPATATMRQFVKEVMEECSVDVGVPERWFLYNDHSVTPQKHARFAMMVTSFARLAIWRTRSSMTGDADVDRASVRIGQEFMRVQAWYLRYI